MTTKASQRARKRQQAGRPREEGVVRYDNGRKDWRATENMSETMGTVITARMNHQGIDEEAAKRDLAGYSLGRLYRDGLLRGKPGQPSAEMLLEAGNRAHADYLRYHLLTGVRPPYPAAMDVTRARGRGGDANKEDIEKAVSRMMGLEGALGIADVQGCHVTSCIKQVILGDADTANWPPSMMAYLLRGLRSLVSFYGLEQP